MRHLSFVIAALASLLCGCASPHSDLLFRSKALLSPEVGLVLASIGPGPHADSVARMYATGSAVHIYFRSLDDSTAVERVITTDGHYWSNGGWKDKEVVRTSSTGDRLLLGYSIKPGRYVVTRAVTSIAGMVSYAAHPRLPSRQEFEVLPNSICYIGSYRLDVGLGKNIVGTAVPASAAISIRNELADDLALLHQVRPELKDASVRCGAAAR